MIIFVVLIILFALFALYLYCLMGRTNHPDMAKFRGWNYAHRGLHNEARPENSMSAFRAALEHGYGIELDVHLLKDGNLVVVHDSSLLRTAGADVKVEDLTREELSFYRLLGSDEPIPLFSQVLDLFAGKAPLIVELKCVDGNHNALCQAACQMLNDYEGLYCMESFDPRAVAWLRRHRPDICRGQLSENWMPKKMPIPGILKWALTYHIANVYTRPDFIAYKYADRTILSNYICRKWLGLTGVSWTLRSREEYDTAIQEGWIPIFENFEI